MHVPAYQLVGFRCSQLASESCLNDMPRVVSLSGIPLPNPDPTALMAHTPDPILNCILRGWVGNGGASAQSIKTGLCGFHSPDVCVAPHIATLSIVNGILLYVVCQFVRHVTIHRSTAKQRSTAPAVLQRMKSLSQCYILTLIFIFSLELFSFIVSQFGLEMPTVVTALLDFIYIAWPVINCVIFVVCINHKFWFRKTKAPRSQSSPHLRPQEERKSRLSSMAVGFAPTDSRGISIHEVEGHDGFEYRSSTESTIQGRVAELKGHLTRMVIEHWDFGCSQAARIATKILNEYPSSELEALISQASKADEEPRAHGDSQDTDHSALHSLVARCVAESLEASPAQPVTWVSDYDSEEELESLAASSPDVNASWEAPLVQREDAT